MISKKLNEEAKIVVENILEKILYYMNVKMNVYPKEDDVDDMHHEIKWIVIDMLNKTNERYENIIKSLIDANMKQSFDEDTADGSILVTLKDANYVLTLPFSDKTDRQVIVNHFYKHITREKA